MSQWPRIIPYLVTPLIIIGCSTGNHRMQSDRSMELAQFLGEYLRQHGKLPASLKEIEPELRAYNPNISARDGQYSWSERVTPEGQREIYVELRSHDGKVYKSVTDVVKH